MSAKGLKGKQREESVIKNEAEEERKEPGSRRKELVRKGMKRMKKIRKKRLGGVLP